MRCHYWNIFIYKLFREKGKEIYDSRENIFLFGDTETYEYCDVCLLST